MPYDGDEVIADSEGEDNGFSMPSGSRADMSLTSFGQPSELPAAADVQLPEQSSISMFSEQPAPRAAHSDIISGTIDCRLALAENNDSISSFQDTSMTSITAQKQRPRPRPIKRKTAESEGVARPDSANTPTNNGSAETKERPSPRAITRKPQDPSSSKSVGTSFQVAVGSAPSMNPWPDESIDPSFGMDIAERAKTRRRAAKSSSSALASPPSQVKSPPPKRKRGAARKEPTVQSLDVIELSSDDDEMALRPSTSKRPKATQKKKKKSTDAPHLPKPLDGWSNHDGPVLANTERSSQPSIPVPTSSLSMRNPGSPLPPSDILGSPLTEPEFPPIAALSEPDSLDMGPPLDRDDDNFFFTPPVATRKRKRPVAYDDSEPESRERVDKVPLPSTFFATSSPPPEPSEDPLPSRVGSDPTNPSKRSKANAKKKDTQSDPIPVRAEPKKPKGKAKKKGAPATEVAEADGTQITVKRKGRGRQKAANIDVPKSREFIDDGVDEITLDPVEQRPSTHDVPVPPTGVIGKNKQANYDAGLDDEPQPPQDDSDGRKSKRNKGRQIVLDDDDPEDSGPSGTADAVNGDPSIGQTSMIATKATKENRRPSPPRIPEADVQPKPAKPALYSRYSIAPRSKPTPMSELIKRVNSLPGSPFAGSPAARAGTAYSPMLKNSRSLLSKIAPLHPNRRTPPPAPPPPPPRKKTKKEIEQEERWEEELIESIGGLDAWVALSDGDRKDLKRGKREMEMNGWDD